MVFEAAENLPKDYHSIPYSQSCSARGNHWPDCNAIGRCPGHFANCVDSFSIWMGGTRYPLELSGTLPPISSSWQGSNNKQTCMGVSSSATDASAETTREESHPQTSILQPVHVGEFGTSYSGCVSYADANANQRAAPITPLEGSGMPEKGTLLPSHSSPWQALQQVCDVQTYINPLDLLRNPRTNVTTRAQAKAKALVEAEEVSGKRMEIVKGEGDVQDVREREDEQGMQNAEEMEIDSEQEAEEEILDFGKFLTGGEETEEDKEPKFLYFDTADTKWGKAYHEALAQDPDHKDEPRYPYCRNSEGFILKRQPDSQSRCYIPDGYIRVGGHYYSMRRVMIEATHHRLQHFGLEKTYTALRRETVWPGQYEDVKDFITRCHTCQHGHTKTRKVRKWQSIWRRPYTITHIDEKGNCTLNLPKRDRGHPVFATDSLQLYYDHPDHKRKQNKVEPSDAEEPRYDIERLVKHRMVKGKEQYLVRWRGYDQDEDTWEDKSELEKTGMDAIMEFHQE